MQQPSASGRRYSEGQVWEYKTRLGDEGSLLKIQKIEQFPGITGDGQVYHVSIIGVRLGRPGLQPMIAHVPVSSETLDASTTRLSDDNMEFPSAEEGISTWRDDEGGVFTMPMGEVVRHIDEISQQRNSTS